jgi:predicted deacetylase
MNSVLFRLDDICPEMNYDKFLRVKTIFDEFGVKPIIGVIPHNKDKSLYFENRVPEFWNLVKDLQCGGWTIAMHGYNHLYTTRCGGKIPMHRRSEFAGLSYSEQLDKIKAGKEILISHSIKTDIFMAPSHTFDNNTLIALKNCGFKYVTDGRSNHPYRYRGLTFIPCKESRIIKSNRFSCICYHANIVTDEEIRTIQSFLNAHNDIVLTFDDAARLKQQFYPIARFNEMSNLIYRKFCTALYPIIKNIRGG